MSNKQNSHYAFTITVASICAAVFFLLLLAIVWVPSFGEGAIFGKILGTLFIVFFGALVYGLVAGQVLAAETVHKWNIDEYAALFGLSLTELFMLFLLVLVWLPAGTSKQVSDAIFGNVFMTVVILNGLAMLVYLTNREVKNETKNKRDGYFN